MTSNQFFMPLKLSFRIPLWSIKSHFPEFVSLWMENLSLLLILTSTSKMRTFLNSKFTAIKRKTRTRGTQSNLSKKQVWRTLSSTWTGATLGTLTFSLSLNSLSSILGEISLQYLKKTVLYSLWNHLFWLKLKEILKKSMKKWKIWDWRDIKSTQ